MKKNKKITLDLVLYLIYGISLFTCFLCNIIINHRLSWFNIVLGGEAVLFSLVNIPRLVHKQKVLWMIGSLYISINFLFVCCWYVTGGEWIKIAMVTVLLGFSLLFLPYILYKMPLPSFLSKSKTLLYFAINSALIILVIYVTMVAAGKQEYLYSVAYPILGISLLYFWICMLVVRYGRIQPSVKVAFCLGLAGVYNYAMDNIVVAITNGEAFVFPKVNLLLWDSAYAEQNVDCIVSLSLFVIAVVCIVMGKKQKS